jgi:uncharacterized protein DUF4381
VLLSNCELCSENRRRPFNHREPRTKRRTKDEDDKIFVNPDSSSLDRLHDIVVPPLAPWWPPAPGWYWVLGIVLVLTFALLFRLTLWWQHNRYRRDALAELATHERALTDPVRRAEAVSAMAELLKRAALTAFPREQVASLTGPRWFAFLDQTGRTTAFAAGSGATLEQAAYDPRTVAALDNAAAKELASVVRHWLAHHRVNADAASKPTL